MRRLVVQGDSGLACARGSVGGDGARVAICTDTIDDVNGVARFVRDVAAWGSGVHVVACTERGTRAGCPWHGAAANIHRVPTRWSCPVPGYAMLDLAWPDAQAVERVIGEVRAQAVHVSTPGPMGWTGRRVAMRRGMPLVGTYHTDFPAYVERLFDDGVWAGAARVVLRRFYAPFDRVLVRSAGFAERLGEVGISRERIRHVPAGVDVERFHPRWRHAAVWSGVLGARVGSVKALYVGRVSVEKNLGLLERMWGVVGATLGRRGVDAQLVIVGDGPALAAMRRGRRDNGMVFTGFRHGAELSAMYASSDVFVFPSHTDTLGQVVLEAQASGLPALVTGSGGPREVVRHGMTGLVLGRNAEWAPALLDLLCDAALRARMGVAARACMEGMRIQEMARAFCELHEGLATKKSRAALSHAARLVVDLSAPAGSEVGRSVPSGQPGR